MPIDLGLRAILSELDHRVSAVRDRIEALRAAHAADRPPDEGERREPERRDYHWWID